MTHRYLSISPFVPHLRPFYHALIPYFCHRTAGSDTTANSTAAVLFYIMRTPRVLARLREELEAAVSVNAMKEDGDGLVWYDRVCFISPLLF